MFSEALVIPRMMSSYCAVSPLVGLQLGVDARELEAVDELAGQVVGVALLVDPDLLEHLAHDQLDVLVVDVHALGLVDLLHLLDEVLLGLGPPADGEQLVRVERALVELRAGLDLLAGAHEQARAPREGVAVLLAGLVGDHDRQGLVGLLDRDDAVLLGDLREALRLARLEELDDARQAVRDVRAGDAAGVEGAHRQLRAGLADRLGRDDADGVADLGQLAGRHRAAVAGLADAADRLALEHRAHRHGDLRRRARGRPRRPRRSRRTPGARFPRPARRARDRAWSRSRCAAMRPTRSSLGSPPSLKTAISM